MRFGSCRSSSALPFHRFCDTSPQASNNNFSIHGGLDFITIQIKLNPGWADLDTVNRQNFWSMTDNNPFFTEIESQCKNLICQYF